MSSDQNLPMNVARVAIPIAILAAGVAAFSVFGQKPEVKQRDESGDRAALVETRTATLLEKPLELDIEGVAVPYRQITLRAEVAGRIKTKQPNVKSGLPVKEKAPLFEIDPTDYQLERDRLDAQIAQSDEEIAAVGVDAKNTDALIKIAREQLVIRERELDRIKGARKSYASTPGEVDAAELQRLTAANALQTLENQKRTLAQRAKTLEKTKALSLVQRRQAEADLQRTKVAATISGTIVTDYVEQDDYVKKGDPLVQINDTATMEVACNLKVEELYWVWLQSRRFSPGEADGGQPPHMAQRFQIPQMAVEVVYPFQGFEYVWKGRLSRYEGTGLDAKTRTVPCRVLIERPGDVSFRPQKNHAAESKARLLEGGSSSRKRAQGNTVTDGSRSRAFSASTPGVVPPALFTGMYVSIRVPVRSPLPLTRIPLAGLRPGNKVWVYRDGKLEIKPVRVARTTKTTALLYPASDSVAPGDRVIVSPLASVTTGMAVRESAK